MASDRDFRLDKISVIMLGVADVDRSLAFYHGTLGMAVQFETPGFSFLNGGGVTLALSQPLAQARAAAPGAVEIVFSVANVRAAHASLVERGVAFQQAPRQVTPDSWAANFVDPDGHQLSIFGPEGSV